MEKKTTTTNKQNKQTTKTLTEGTWTEVTAVECCYAKFKVCSFNEWPLSAN
jgi:hypothetical protein